MKHHIIIKFLAVFLCAASLLGALGSGLGLFAVTELGLRGKTLEEAYADSLRSTAEALADELAVRYASRELGGADESLINQYYGSYWMSSTFDWDQVGYVIRDEGGNVLKEAPSDFVVNPAVFEITTVGSRYVNVLNKMTQDEYEAIYNPVTEPSYYDATEPYSGLTVYNAVPVEGCDITYLHVTFQDGHGEDYDLGGEVLGTLSYYTSNQLIFRFVNQDSLQPLIQSLRSNSPVHMICGTQDGGIMLEISAPDGILDEFSNNDGGHSYFILRPLEEAVQLPMGSVYDAIPPEGQAVSWISVIYADGYQESIAVNDGTIGYLGYDEEGNVVFTADFAGLLDYRTDHVTYIAFEDRDRSLIYEASDSASVGRFYLEDNVLRFRSREPVTVKTEPSVSDEGIYIYDDVPPGGYQVYRMELWLEGASRGLVIEGAKNFLGLANHDDSGNVTFTAQNWQDFVFSKPANVVYILMETEDGRLLYEARQEGAATGSGCAIGTFAYDEEGELVFTRSVAAPAMASMAVKVEPSVTAPETAAEEETIPASETVNIHVAPHLDSTVIGVLEAGMPLEILDTQVQNGQEWGKVDGGWILLSAAASAAEETVPETTEIPEETVEVTMPPMAEETLPEATDPTMAAETPTEPQMTEETQPGITAPAMEEETEVPTEPTYAVDTTDVTEPEVGFTIPASIDPYETALAEDTLRAFGYYDGSIGEHMVVEYTYEDMPAYTVEIMLGPGALRNQYEWVLMEQVYLLGDYLIPVLIVSLVLFAITAVYLCCAAGKKPGSTEIRASGLNCIPIDLYLAAAAGGVVLCAFGVVEGGGYLMQKDPQTGMLFVALCAYSACLLFVGFCFAFAAQVKTPNGYFWRNSLCGKSLKIIAWLWRKFVILCGWLWKIIDEKLEPLLVRVCKAAWKLTKFFWLLLKKGITWLCRKLIRGCDWLGRVLGRFLTMLPLTWQFLLIGFILVIFLYIMIRTYKVGYILIGFGVFFGVILYAASAFGILLENAKRMRKGDLDSKVDEKLLIGTFRDFADELNGLADVAVVAAQKQLKSERMKTELITNVSHDIKTPLTSIINYVDLMEKPHSPEEQAAYLEVLSRQSQRLKKLIDDLMEMSKASTGNMAVDITRVNAGEAVNQALGEFADKLERCQLIPVFRQPEKEIYMMADGRLVWRVLSNILSNAVKYALPGTRLYIDLMELDGKVVLSLKNISRESLNVSADELLERFVRGDTARNTEGSGLGLNIAQSLMELQKGKLELLVDGDLFKVTLIFPGI